MSLVKKKQSAFFWVSVFLLGCRGYEARSQGIRMALDQNRPQVALQKANEALGVERDQDFPEKLEGDNALLVLDRGTVQQALCHFKESKRDLETADKAIDLLDMSRGALDEVGKHIFSDSSGRYKAPAYEKLLINTINMINYLALGDLQGARVEARRFNVIRCYLDDKPYREGEGVIRLAGFLAGLIFEKSGEADEALRYYAEAWEQGEYATLRQSIVGLLQKGVGYIPENLRNLGENLPSSTSARDSFQGEVIILVGYGRVPNKISNRVPIGQALNFASSFLDSRDIEAADRLAAQGFITWINYPSLAPEPPWIETPQCLLDGKLQLLEEAVNLSVEVQAAWKKIEGKIIASAITRLLARYIAGEGARYLVGKDSIYGVLSSLVVRGGLTVMDTPDTRSWDVLPARVAVSRVRVPSGQHVIELSARGAVRKEQINIPQGGWVMVTLSSLR
ncbi:hypothetical protein [Pajaroellobacter abortibovis]|uniref:Uncharacterized protein n=1 Tax=Pajaroellobacter abortibovis TaxID=1882918 RepID=A0A1L6MZ04_9BACT|nr:hypothetical protein [Pajaroellobacter abortibovis]APS00615.1 hypothetical protein BCY86_07975 [Pajaroellobacter abortibovis]